MLNIPERQENVTEEAGRIALLRCHIDLRHASF
jgi:hypothetical protein